MRMLKLTNNGQNASNSHLECKLTALPYKVRLIGRTKDLVSIRKFTTLDIMPCCKNTGPCILLADRLIHVLGNRV